MSRYMPGDQVARPAALRTRRLIIRRPQAGGPAWRARRVRLPYLPCPFLPPLWMGNRAFPRPFHDHEGSYTRRIKPFAIMKPLALASHPDVAFVSAGPPSLHSGRQPEPVTLSRAVTHVFPRVPLRAGGRQRPEVLPAGGMMIMCALMRRAWK